MHHCSIFKYTHVLFYHILGRPKVTPKRTEAFESCDGLNDVNRIWMSRVVTKEFVLFYYAIVKLLLLCGLAGQGFLASCIYKKNRTASPQNFLVAFVLNQR